MKPRVAPRAGERNELMALRAGAIPDESRGSNGRAVPESATTRARRASVSKCRRPRPARAGTSRSPRPCPGARCSATLRYRRMVRRRLVQRDVQELRRLKRIGRPGNLRPPPQAVEWPQSGRGARHDQVRPRRAGERLRHSPRIRRRRPQALVSESRPDGESPSRTRCSRFDRYLKRLRANGDNSEGS